MKHELDVINAALRLGCRAVPPVGAVIALVPSGAQYVVVTYGTVTVRAETLEGGFRHTLWKAAPYEVVELPPDAPPFEKWEVYGGPPTGHKGDDWTGDRGTA